MEDDEQDTGTRRVDLAKPAAQAAKPVQSTATPRRKARRAATEAEHVPYRKGQGGRFRYIEGKRVKVT